MRRTIRKAGFIGMPRWLSDSMSAIGLSAVLYVLAKYTFVGEMLERVYVNTFGQSPVDEIGSDLRSAGRELSADLRSASRELDRI